jgi:hypothetical protein
MWIIKYLNTTSKEVLVETLVAKKETTARQWAKQFLLHHSEYELLAIRPC